MRVRSAFALVCLSLTLLCTMVYAEQTACVESFSPHGVVKKVRQVSVRFSEQMVAFGDPRLEDPLEMKCPAKGKGRWADGKNWIYDFDEDLPAGIVCEFELKPGMKTLSGKELTGERAFSFSTGGPAVVRSEPYEGSGVDENQIFILTLDTEATEESIPANVSFSVEGIGERIGVRILKGEERNTILKASSYYGREAREIQFLDEYCARLDGMPVIVLQAGQSFPNKAVVRLVWGKGVISAAGIPTTEDQVLSFKSRAPFLATFTCPRENPEAPCIPFLSMCLGFSAPVPKESAGRTRLKGANKVYKPKENKDELVEDVCFEGPFPEKTEFVIEIPSDLRDDAGRALANRDKFPLRVSTGEYPPLAKFSSRFGIIEKADPVLPVTLRNLEPEVKARIVETAGKKGILAGLVDKCLGRMERVEDEKDLIAWLRKASTAGRSRSILKGETKAGEFEVPKPGGERAFEVVGIPLKKTGFYVVELESTILGASLLGAREPVYVPTAALVTNLSAHFKWGRESSVVWVTTLDKAEPVKGAAVTIRNCSGEILWEGRTDERGIAHIGKELRPKKCPLKRDEDAWYDSEQLEALESIGGGLFVFARTSDDMTFVHSSWIEGIERWRFKVPVETYWGPVVAHTVLDRTLLRAGETVHMKHFIRKHVMSGFSLLKKDRIPKAVAVQHEGSSESYEFPLRWDPAGGIAETVWKIPEGAKLGAYRIVMLKKATKDKKSVTYYEQHDDGNGVDNFEEDDNNFSYDEYEYYQGRRERNYYVSGSFRVEEFRVPLMKASILPPREPIINQSETGVDLLVTYLSGGGATGLPVKLRSRTAQRSVAFDDYEGFTFSNGEVKEGKATRYEDDRDEDRERKLPTLDLTLGAGGALRTGIEEIPRAVYPQNLHTELEFKDANGEIQTVTGNVPLWPSMLVLGIKPDSWVSSKDALKFHLVSLNTAGKPVPNRRVKVDLFKQRWYSHRKRLVGGFYSYEHVTEVTKIGQVLEGDTDGKGILICEIKSPVSGEVIIQATASDDAGNVSVVNRSVWVAGDEEWWFDVSDTDRIDILPEKKRYEPGEKARFQVRMPFREATALVTVEREGVIDLYIQRLSGKAPVVDVPVKENYAPNVFVSVLCVRGRVGDIKPTATVDLGKPAFKLGISEIKVGWLAHELKVNVQAGKSVYKIREKVPVKIAVRKADGKPLPAGAEVALAAVDEGILELMPNDSWKLLDSMRGERGNEVSTSTAQSQVVGKRHYGRKALPPGGGGGKQSTREIFDTLLLWKGRLSLDKSGEGSIEIPLGDALTSFRIVAVASAASGLFGTGHTSIRTTQDLMILSGLPEVVKEGDRFKAGFTLRNASERPLRVEVSAKIDTGGESKALDTLEATLSPGQAAEMGWPVSVPYGTDSLKWEVSAREKDGEAKDALRTKQKVVTVAPVRVFQATLMQLEDALAMKVERPEDAIPGRGGIRVSLRPRLSDEVDGVVRYMKAYPYVCLEQRVSKAVALRDEAIWKRVMAELPGYLDSDGLAKYFPSCPWGSDTLTAYILSIAHEAGWTIPEPQRSSMENGVEGFIEGRVIRWSSLPTADVSIRKMAALEALSRYGKARPGLLDSIAVEPDLWPTSAALDWFNVLARCRDIPDRDKRLKQAEQVVRSRLNFQGTTLGFSTEKTDYLWWLMVSIDSNAVRSVLSFLDLPAWKEDMPRLLRGAVSRQERGRWNTTVANAWGVLALEKFAKKFEATPVSGVSHAGIQKDEKSLDWAKSPDGGSIQFGWPKRKEDLKIMHQGAGKPWVTVQSLAAIPLKGPFSSGFKIKKSYLPVEQRQPGKWTSGDVVRVKLEIDSQADMTWVVVNDPIPSGAAILGSGLGRDSSMLTSGERQKGWVWPAFEERSFEAFRAYYEFVAKGKWSLEYTMRLNNEGVFQMPETRVEALYSPEMLGEIPNGTFRIE
ncbi:MAG: MG2 domain-containing protein [Pseudomonadota bacterium]